MQRRKFLTNVGAAGGAGLVTISQPLLAAGPVLCVSTAAAVMVTPDSITWEPIPGLLPGAKRALLVGDKFKPGPYVERVELPAGFRIAPHWHATGDENVTIFSGILSVGTGDIFDESKMQDLPAGSFYFAPPNTHHYVMAKTVVTGQAHGFGPVERVFVNPADDPRNRKEK